MTPDPSNSTQLPAPDVTVVVPMRNEAGQISRCLQCIVDQDHPSFEIVVVDSASTDGSADAVAQFLGSTGLKWRVVTATAPSTPHAMNLGLAAATGRVLVRVDAHAYPSSDYVRRLVALLDSSGASGVGGQKRAVAQTRTGRSIAAAMSSRLGVGNSPYHFDGEMRAVAHVPFGTYLVDNARSIGGWDETFRAHQDFEFDQRMSRTFGDIVIDPSIVIDWDCRETVLALYRQYRRYGEGKAHVAFRHPSSVRARHLLPIVVPIAVVLAVVGGVARCPLLVLPLGLYGGAVILGSVLSAQSVRQRGGSAMRFAAAVAAMHSGWGVGLVRGLFKFSGTKAWTAASTPGQDRHEQPV